ncbi:MAG: ribonuclease HI family protein [Myxococcales bacterium]|nr:ribonuclease HI family protein [Myxococcales bacterium]
MRGKSSKRLSLDPHAWTIHCDGAALKGRGATGLGATLLSPTGARHEVCEPAPVGCNTQAEGWALVAALKAARRLGARALTIYCDNTVVIEQTIGETRTQVPRLVPIFAEARALVATFDAVTITWLPRRKNGEADALARAALGLARKAG